MKDPIAIVLGQSDLDLLYAVSGGPAADVSVPPRAWLREQRQTPVQEMPRRYAEHLQIALRGEIRFGSDLNRARQAEVLDERLSAALKAH